MPPGLAYNQSACYLIRLSIPEPARFESGRSRSALRPKYGTRFCQWPVERRFGRFWDKPSNLATDSQPAVVPLAGDARFHIRWRFLPIDNSCHRRSSKASRPRPKTSNNKKAEMRSRVRVRAQRRPSPNRRNLRDIRSLLALRSRPDSHHILHDRRIPPVHHILRDHRPVLSLHHEEGMGPRCVIPFNASPARPLVAYIEGGLRSCCRFSIWRLVSRAS
jgi:hypothetical protein